MRNFQQPGRSAVFASNAMAATSHPLATKTAIEVMQTGGNAVDAAIAAAILLGFCEPHMTGLGGDMFALFKLPGSDEIKGLNASGRAPAALSCEALRAAGHRDMPSNQAAAVTIPGAVDGFCRLHNDFGRLELGAVLAPAIRFAEEGVPVAPRVARDLAGCAEALQGSARDHFLLGGKAPALGQRFRAPMQAEVLRRVAKEGRAAFYEGEIAEDMVNSLRALGGVHGLEDFATCASNYVEPIRSGYGGAELIELPPNGQGAAAMLIANILSHFDIAGMDPLGAERLHIEAEATKLGYDARNRFLSDPDHMARLDHMLAPETARDLAALIDPKRALPNPAVASEAVHKETVYLTVVDRDRMAVSMIYSIFHSYGSGLASDRFGILFHSRGAGFTLQPGHPNEAGPGKRPMHTIIPAMLQEAGGACMPFGVMGGQYQATGHARFVSNIVDFGMDPQSAIDAPRAFAEFGKLRLEQGYGDDVRQQLSDMGHDIEVAADPIGGAQAIRIHARGGLLEGASDPRKDGIALGD